MIKPGFYTNMIIPPSRRPALLLSSIFWKSILEPWSTEPWNYFYRVSTPFKDLVNSYKKTNIKKFQQFQLYLTSPFNPCVDVAIKLIFYAGIPRLCDRWIVRSAYIDPTTTVASGRIKKPHAMVKRVTQCLLFNILWKVLPSFRIYRIGHGLSKPLKGSA